MTGRQRLLALAAGFGAGAAGGLFGVGGGLVLIPILTAFFGLTQHRAHGTSLAVIGATALVAVMVYGWHGNVAWGTAAIVALASIFTARIGARLTTRFSPHGLARVFAVFLFLVALRMLWKAPEPTAAAFHTGVAAIWFDLALGAAVGIVAGFMGVGGGIISVPVFTLGLGMTQQLAQGTSLAVILVAAPAGAIEHARHGNVTRALVPILAAGALLGGPFASWLVQGLPQALLARGFALFLLANAVHTWLRADRSARAARHTVATPSPRSFSDRA
jgi:uncharacterized membrane protein YfcA